MMWDWQVPQTSLEKHPYLMISVSNNGAGKIQGFPVNYARNVDSLFKFPTPYFFLMRIISYCMQEQYDSVPASQGISQCFFKFFL